MVELILKFVESTIDQNEVNNMIGLSNLTLLAQKDLCDFQSPLMKELQDKFKKSVKEKEF